MLQHPEVRDVTHWTPSQEMLEIVDLPTYRIVLGALLMLAVTSCEVGGAEVSGTATESVAEARQADESSRDHHYSAFGVQIETSKFKMMSFKDVGLNRTDPSASDRLLEAIAQSVAYEFHRAPDIDPRARVVHDKGLADPDNHTYCESGRVYVDIWRSPNPDRWGYSLWSGCSKSRKFASGETKMTVTPENGDLHRAVEPLAKGIVGSFSSAVDEGCFQRKC